VTGPTGEKDEGSRAFVVLLPPPPLLFSLPHGKYVEYLNKSKQPK